MIRAGVRAGALLIGSALCATSCVWPVPLAGEPVPEMTVDVHWTATGNTFTVDVSVSDLSASLVLLWPLGPGGPVLRDSQTSREREVDQ